MITTTFTNPVFDLQKSPMTNSAYAIGFQQYASRIKRDYNHKMLQWQSCAFLSSNPKVKLSQLFKNIDRRFPKKSKYVAESDLLFSNIGPKNDRLPFSSKQLSI